MKTMREQLVLDVINRVIERGESPVIIAIPKRKIDRIIRLPLIFAKLVYGILA